MDKILQSKEVNIIQLIKSIWDGKWIILSAIALFVFGSMLALWGKPQEFVATSEVSPISSADQARYRNWNAIGNFFIFSSEEEQKKYSAVKFLPLMVKNHLCVKSEPCSLILPLLKAEISKSSILLNELFIEQLRNKSLILELFKKHKLLVRENFASEMEYDLRLKQLASKLIILSPIIYDGHKAPLSNPNFKISIRYSDVKKWRNFLSDLKAVANENVRSHLKKYFETEIVSLKKRSMLEIEKLDIEIDFLKKQHQSKISDELDSLKAQQAIAREAGLAKSVYVRSPAVIEDLMKRSSVENVLQNSSEIDLFTYLHGYEVLEKQIQILSEKLNENSVSSEISQLEKMKQTFANKLKLSNLRSEFADTPIMDPKHFKSVELSLDKTEFKYDRSRTLMVSLSGVLGAILGLVIVLAAREMKNKTF